MKKINKVNDELVQGGLDFESLQGNITKLQKPTPCQDGLASTVS